MQGADVYAKLVGEKCCDFTFQQTYHFYVSDLVFFQCGGRSENAAKCL